VWITVVLVVRNKQLIHHPWSMNRVCGCCERADVFAWVDWISANDWLEGGWYICSGIVDCPPPRYNCVYSIGEEGKQKN
jgi:hypothetical protein